VCKSKVLVRSFIIGSLLCCQTMCSYKIRLVSNSVNGTLVELTEWFLFLPYLTRCCENCRDNITKQSFIIFARNIIQNNHRLRDACKKFQQTVDFSAFTLENINFLFQVSDVELKCLQTFSLFESVLFYSKK